MGTTYLGHQLNYTGAMGQDGIGPKASKLYRAKTNNPPKSNGLKCCTNKYILIMRTFITFNIMLMH